MGRFEYLPGKIVPCGLEARRHHGTKTGPNNGHGAPGNEEDCRGMWHNAFKAAFWQAHEQLPQLPEFEDFYEPLNAVTAPQPVDIPDPQEREKAGTYSGFDIPT